MLLNCHHSTATLYQEVKGAKHFEISNELMLSNALSDFWKHCSGKYIYIDFFRKLLRYLPNS